MIDTIRLRMLLVALAGWVNRHQLDVIDYLREENRVLREHLGGRRLRLTDAQRQRLAAKGHGLGRRVLSAVATLVTPDTILRWHRHLIACKWTAERRRVGRPGVRHEIRHLAVRMARENPTWGYRRIQGALKNLGHRVARSTVAKILQAHGIGPVPERPMSWRTFLAAHWGAIAAADFFTTEVWTARGLVTYYTLFVIELASRRVHLVASTLHPDEAFVLQIARTVTAADDGCLLGYRILICDRDTKWSGAFRQTLADTGIRVVQTPYRAPNCNAHAERFVRSIKEECLDRLVFLGEAHLRRTLIEFVAHYHRERNHQGLHDRLIAPEMLGPPDARVQCRTRLGGAPALLSSSSLTARPNFRIVRPRATVLIRIMIGAVFLSEGMQKFLFPAQLGVGRFMKIGLSSPEILAPFVGGVEITCGTLVILGLATRLAAVPLLCVMTVALAATKYPILMAQGFWAAAHEARTDWSMFLGALFLLFVGAGPWSLDAHVTRNGKATLGHRRS